MKIKKTKIIFSIIFTFIVISVVFGFIDSLRIYGNKKPIFTFYQKQIDGDGYSGEVNVGLGYKIIVFNSNTDSQIIKIGSLFSSEQSPFKSEEIIIEEVTEISDSGNTDSNDENNKERITTFGEKYKDTISIEGTNEEVYVENLNSKIGYSMKFYYDLFEYTGYEDHDKYTWKLTSGDSKSTMTIYDISNETAYKEALENINKKDLFEEISGESNEKIEKLYYRTSKENDIEKSNYVYLMKFDDLRLMVDLYLPIEAEEGVGKYMHSMANSISKI